MAKTPAIEPTDQSVMSCQLLSHSNLNQNGAGDSESAFGLTLNSNFAERNQMHGIDLGSKSFSNAAIALNGNKPHHRGQAEYRRDSSCGGGFQSGEHGIKSFRS